MIDTNDTFNDMKIEVLISLIELVISSNVIDDISESNYLHQ